MNHSIRLRIWLPIFVFVTFVLLLLLSAAVQRTRLMAQIDEGGLQIVGDTMESTARHFSSYANHTENNDFFAAEIAALSLNPNIDFIGLIDANGVIAYSSTLALRGVPAQQAIKEFETGKFSSVQQGQRLAPFIDASKNRIYAYQAVVLPKKPDEIRSSRLGALFIAYDLSSDKRDIMNKLVRQSALIWAIGIALMLLLEWALRRWLTQPLSYLASAFSALSGGDYSARTKIKGHGELFELAGAFNMLAAELGATLHAIPDLIFEFDHEGTYLKVFGGQEHLLAAPKNRLLGRRVSEVLPADATHAVLSAIAEADEKGTSQGKSFCMTVAAGERWFELSVAKKYIETERTQTYILISRDITSRQQAQLKIQESERLALQALADLEIQKFALDQHSIVAITDVRGDIIYVNKKFCELSQYAEAELLGHNHRILNSGFHPQKFFTNMYRTIASGEVWQGEICNRAKDGSLYWVATTIVPFMGGDKKPKQYIAIRTDITESKTSEEKIRQLAFYDTLTGLPNRRLLQDRLKQAIAASARSGLTGALMFLDLDHFKNINDIRGHELGDQLLVEVSNRLRREVREGDTVARLGGDEFVVALESLSEDVTAAASQAATIAEKIRSSIAQSYRLSEQDFSIGVSIGICLYKNHDQDAGDILKHADAAMYLAKNEGRNAVRFYDPGMQKSLEERTRLLDDLRLAIRDEQLELYYQIQVENHGVMHPHAAEVLLRWKHPIHGFISPATFIPLAEESGLILQIGHWVLKSAIAQLSAWRDSAKLRDIQLAVNVSPKQFRQADFAANLQSLMDSYEIEPSRLKLELTESLVIDDVDGSIKKMLEIKKMGVRFSLDDFGTGYSSLSYLKRLPLDQIKIDQSFVRDIVSDSNDAAIVQAIIAIGKALGIAVIAEGVETQAQLDFMEEHGCHDFQGYLFSKPIPVAEFEQLLNNY